MRITLEFYVPVFVSLFFNVKHMSFTEGFDYFSLLVALTFAILMLIIPINYARILYKNRKRLDDPLMISCYGVLYRGLKRTSTIAILTY